MTPRTSLLPILPFGRDRRTCSSSCGRRSSRVRALGASLVLCLALAISACAPGTTTVVTGSERPLDELARVALVAHHRMEIVYLETGGYTTNALIDLELPRGVKWTLEDFSEESYTLRFTDDAQPGVAWLVTPEGVTRAG